MVRQKIAEILKKAGDVCKEKGMIPAHVTINPIIEIPREKEHGDYSTNLAFVLAPGIRKSPVNIANIIIENMSFQKVCEKVEVAGKGFINFYVKDDIWRETLLKIHSRGIDTFMPDVGSGKRVLIEFVSANPTGPLHIGHGRGAAVGDVLANIMRNAGYEVTKEYYVNDAGRQIATLGESTYGRWRQLRGEDVDFPKELYQGDYVKDLAQNIMDEGIAIPDDREEAVSFMAEYSSEKVMDGIKEDLKKFGVFFESYYRESLLYRTDVVDKTLKKLSRDGFAYENDGALWFKVSSFEHDEDRVLVKSDGEKTYFASDIAYHEEKYNRGFDLLVDLWGSDHHGYIPRMKASIQALGKNKNDLKVILVQFVTLLKGGKPVGMSTRSGEFTTLSEVLDEVGRDAARFFFLMRKGDAHLEFDLDLAKKTTNENPVFYVQYAHARIESIFRNAAEDGIDMASFRKEGSGVYEGLKDNIGLLTLKEEIDLIKGIFHFYDVIEGSAKSLEPHRLTFYLIDLVGGFHSYYNKTRVLKNEKGLTMARLLLLVILQGVIRKGLTILGVSAPERM